MPYMLYHSRAGSQLPSRDSYAGMVPEAEYAHHQEQQAQQRAQERLREQQPQQWAQQPQPQHWAQQQERELAALSDQREPPSSAPSASSAVVAVLDAAAYASVDTSAADEPGR